MWKVIDTFDAHPIVLNRRNNYPGGITSQQGGGLAGCHSASEILYWQIPNP
jgi:hypothetical protein